MKCSKCRHDNPDKAKFCLECGSPMSVTCGNCGEELPPGAKFCLECGTRVGEDGSTLQDQFEIMQQALPSSLAEKLSVQADEVARGQKSGQPAGEGPSLLWRARNPHELIVRPVFQHKDARQDR